MRGCFLACVEVGTEEGKCSGDGRGCDGVRQWLYCVKEEKASDGLTGCCVGPWARLESKGVHKGQGLEEEGRKKGAQPVTPFTEQTQSGTYTFPSSLLNRS